MVSQQLTEDKRINCIDNRLELWSRALWLDHFICFNGTRGRVEQSMELIDILN